MKTLIVYYSWHNGNTKRIAEMIQKRTGADLCAIETVTPYPEEYRAASDQGKRETETGFKPEIKKLPYDIASYERIVIGMPTWWYTMAPAVLSFIDGNDFTGKTVIPFMTNAGWPGTVIEDMIAHLKGAKIMYPMEILFDEDGGDTLITDEKIIEEWIDKFDC